MNLQRIGKGAFSVAYLETETTVLVASEDPVKECMGLGWFPDSPLFPPVERIAYGLYRMPYYQKTAKLKESLDPDQWAIYQTLRRIYVKHFHSNNDYDYLDHWRAEFGALADSELKETMLECLDALSNYGADIGFEISPRNVAVKDGKLILLDVFYFIKKVKAIREKRCFDRPMTKREVIATLKGN
jgi:hypothetical protein